MLCPGWPDVRQPPETGIGREDELLRYKSRWGASVRHPIERLPGDTSPILVCVVALLGAELEFGEGAHCLRRKDDLCDAGNVVREERVDVEDELVLPEETPVEQEPVQEETTEEPLNQELPKTDDDGDYFF